MRGSVDEAAQISDIDNNTREQLNSDGDGDAGSSEQTKKED